ncbi:MAG: Rqc2 family fibronectin-binding protein [Peptococcaceae bacterium]
MSLDGIAIRAVTDELNEKLTGGRIDKIQQPDKHTIIMNIRQPGKNYKLLISVNPQTARLHLTNINRSNPTHPPIFCMVLRKHLEGSKITEISQQGLERIVHFTCEGYNDLGDRVTKVLIGEFMGKHSNLILLNLEKHLIIDSLKHFTHNTNQYREILPGISYIAPPAQGKKSLETMTPDNLIDYLMNLPPGWKGSKALLNTLAGIGPQTARELVWRAGLDVDAGLEFWGEYEYTKLWQAILWLQDILRNQKYTPVLVKEEDKSIAFAPFDLQQFSRQMQTAFPSMSELIEFYIGRTEVQNLFKQKTLDLERLVDKELERCERKLALQLEKIAEEKTSEKYRIWGELLTANLYNLKQGNEAVVTDFYDENLARVTIPLEPNLTPNENAQKYFKKYAKAKVGSEKAHRQSLLTIEEINYLESIKNSLEKADSLNDLQEIRWEMEETGYVKHKPVKNKDKEKQVQIKPLEAEIAGFKILIGKNNKQNDYLTLKLAKNEDIWLHVKDIPGSHVIIKNPERKEIPGEVLETAANLAGYFSKARYSAQVPVDYTLKKNIKKPNGAKPGMVIYDGQKTIYITPDEKKVLQLMNKPAS